MAVCLLDGGADINQQERYGSCFTPLLKACYAGDLKMVNLLLDRGADPSICSSCWRPPVSFATTREDVEMVRSLLRHEGARLTIDFHPAAAGTTALGVACSQHRTEIANLLLQAGADPYLFDSHGPHSSRAIAKAWK